MQSFCIARNGSRGNKEDGALLAMPGMCTAQKDLLFSNCCIVRISEEWQEEDKLSIKRPDVKQVLRNSTK
jgi:hypothetical protein